MLHFVVMKEERIVLGMDDMCSAGGVVHNTPSIGLSRNAIIVKLGIVYVNTWHKRRLKLLIPFEFSSVYYATEPSRLY